MDRTDPKIWLFKKPSGVWAIRWKDPETGRVLQKSTKTKEKKQAERLLGEFHADLRNGRYGGPNRTPWPVFREKYETEYLSGLADATAAKVNTIFDAVEEVLRPNLLSEVTAARISKLVAVLRDRKLAESTIAGNLAHLRSALNWAVDIGLLGVLPKFPKLHRAKKSKKPKGRAPTEKEFERILAAIPGVVGVARAPSWQHYLKGLWLSGLRLSESLDLWWDRADKIYLKKQGDRLFFVIHAELEKGHQDRLLPVAPEFQEFLELTPPDERKGPVFNPKAERLHGERLNRFRVCEIIASIGKAADVVVNVSARTGKKKYASAHDLRRAFGDRWALRVMPAVLMELMRHESIETSMTYYVGRSADATADVIWQAYRSAKPTTPDQKEGQRDTLRDTPPKPDQNEKEPPDTNAASDGPYDVSNE